MGKWYDGDTGSCYTCRLQLVLGKYLTNRHTEIYVAYIVQRVVFISIDDWYFMLLYLGQNSYIRIILYIEDCSFFFFDRLINFKMIELWEGKFVLTLNDEW